MLHYCCKVIIVILPKNLAAVMEHEIELLNKKHGESKALQAKKQANIELANRVYEILSNATTGMTATEIAMALGEDGNEYTNQKATALLKILGDKVVANMDGKRKLFTVA
jgi:hypothetical protein